MPTERTAPRDLEIVMIAAVSDNGVIGSEGDLPWHLPDDLKHFKRTTSGKTLIMGRKTFDSIDRKPLPNRRNIVMTRDDDEAARIERDGGEAARNLDEALALAEPDGEAWIAGGGYIYALAMPVATRLELTRVHTETTGDATFPAIDAREWQLEHEDRREADERHAVAFTFQTWKRTAPPASSR
jgi:dihydrofolate reductase